MRRSTFIGFVAAPPVGVLVFALWGIGSLIFSKESSQLTLSAIGHVLLLIFLFGIPIAYGIAVLIGVPLYRVLSTARQLGFWSVVLPAGLIAAIVVPYATTGFFGPQRQVAFLALIGLSAGSAVGMVFWLIAVRHRGSNMRGESNAM